MQAEPFSIANIFKLWWAEAGSCGLRVSWAAFELLEMLGVLASRHGARLLFASLALALGFTTCSMRSEEVWSVSLPW